MAKPDLNDGYVRYAHELDAALKAAGFTKAAGIVLREVFAQIYGSARHATATLSASEIARRMGRKKQFIDRGLRELREAKVLIPQPDGPFRFIKDYESWVDARGNPRFTEAELAWIASAPRMALSHKRSLARNSSTQVMTHQQSSVITSVDETSTHLVKTVNSNDHPPLYSPYQDNSEKGEKRIPPSAATTHADAASSDLISPIPGHEEAIAEARGSFGDEAARMVRAQGRDIARTLGGRFDLYAAALRKARRARAPIADLHPYCLAAARAYLADGIPSEPVAATPEASIRPASHVAVRDQRLNDLIDRACAALE